MVGSSGQLVKKLKEVERLDFIAREEAAKVYLFRSAMPLTVVAGFIVLLGFTSTASFQEMFAIRVLAILLVATTALVWFRPRYAGYVLLALWFGVQIGRLFSYRNTSSLTYLGPATICLIFTIGALEGYRWWKNRSAMIDSSPEELNAERYKVQKWISELRSPIQMEPIVQFSSGSFWRARWKYSLLKSGPFWVIGVFGTGFSQVRFDCRVMDLDAVRITDEEKVHIRMGEHFIAEIEMSRDMRERLLNLVRHGA
jgi:hypothetical protein